ncbi:hypothetical protein [Pseudomonas sp. LP_7_YM]|uniref:hypothetical protein n=1 Tax=Pseudomonas sp. LP_7_YM TaxID=2485137 RepID=UPI00105D5218|nr:hypothetical protein [Pseudomonas sp. LP_7_YM]
MNAIFLQQFEGQIAAIETSRRTIVSVIEKWALRGVVVFFVAWMAILVGQWSARAVSAIGNERLASLSSMQLPDSPAASVNKHAHGNTVAAGSLAQSNP